MHVGHAAAPPARPALAKTVIALASVVPLLLLIPMLGEHPHIGQVAQQQATRDATWEAFATQECLRRPWRSGSDQGRAYYVHRLDAAVEPGVADEDTVATCEQLFDADLRGLQPPTQQERAPYGELRLRCYAERAVRRGKEPGTSFLSDFQMDENHFRALPPELVTVMSPGQQSDRVDEIIDAGGRLGDVIDLTMAGPAYDYGNARQSKMIAVRDSDGWVQEWKWLARGDLDHDGVDDLLLTSRLYSPDGVSLDDHRLFLVTKHAASSPIELVQEIPLYPGDESTLCGERANRCARGPSAMSGASAEIGEGGGGDGSTPLP